MSNNSSTVDRDLIIGYMLLFNLIAWGYVGMILSVFGIVGNVITLLVLLSPSMRTTSTNIYLTALSFSNIIFLSMVISSQSTRSILEYRSYMRNEPPSALEILLIRLPTTPIYYTALVSIIYLTIAVSIDRLILVKFPLKAKAILTQRRTLIAILSIYIFSIVYCIPFWLQQQYDPEINDCRLTEIGEKTYIYTGLYIYIPVVYLIPLITLTCINIAIIKNLIGKKRRKKTLGIKTNLTRQADNYAILILVTATILFSLCRLPHLIISAWHAICHLSVTYRLFFLLHEIGGLLFLFNISTNFIVHCFFGEKFREILIKFILNRNRQRNFQRRRLSDKEKQRNLQPPEQKQIISSDNSSTTNDLKKSIDLNNTSNQNLIPNSSINKQELSPLMTNSEEITVIDEDVSLKLGQNHN